MMIFMSKAGYRAGSGDCQDWTVVKHGDGVRLMNFMGIDFFSCNFGRMGKMIANQGNVRH